MQQATYEKLKETYKTFDSLFTDMVDIDDIILDVYNTQVRKDGAVVKNIPKMSELYKATPNTITPPSVRRLPNGKLELKDGVTRVEGAREAGCKQIRVSHYHDHKGFTTDQWYDFQCSQNDHPVQQPNSHADIEHQIKVRVDKGVFERKLGFKYTGNESKFLDQAAEYMREVYANSGLSTKKLKHLVKKALSGMVSQQYKNYTKDGAIKNYDSMNKRGIRWPEPGEKCIKVDSNGWSVYPCKSISQISTNALGNAAKKKVANPLIKIVIVFWVADLAGKDDETLLKIRKKAKQLFTDLKNKVKVNGQDVFDEFDVLPQIKTGPNQENLYRLVP